MMDDLISRQAAIEALDKRFDNIPMEQTAEILMLRKDLRELPTIQTVATGTNVGDTISRQAAIDALDFEIVHMTAYCDGKNEGNPFAQYNKGLEDGKKAIEALPSAQPEQHEGHWIPVSERLPGKGGEYLVSVHHTIGAISVFHPEKDTYVDDVAIMKYYGKFPSTVRAWMPMPEAYKPNK